MNAQLTAIQAEDIYTRIDAILCNGDTWRGRAFELRCVFDLLLNYASNCDMSKESAFWQKAIDSIFTDEEESDSDKRWHDELHQLRLWFNKLQHSLNDSYLRGRFKKYDRRTVLDAMEAIADFTAEISGVPIHGQILGACRHENTSEHFQEATIVFVCELYSAPEKIYEGARLLDALGDIAKEKKIRNMGAEIDVYSIVYSPSLLQFSDKDGLNDDAIVTDGPVDKALRRALGILKASKAPRRWLVWRASNPDFCEETTIKAIDEATEALGLSIFPMACTDDATEIFREFWPKRRVYRVTPMLPDNMVASILETLVSCNV